MNANRRLTRWDRFVDSCLGKVLALFLIVLMIGFCVWQYPSYTVEESVLTGVVTVKKDDGTIVTNINPKTVRTHHVWVR